MMIPLFPLKISILPQEVLPLHIFEDRYKKMVSNCIENKHLFGMIYRDKGQFSNIGCSVKIHKTLNSYDDGKYDILVQGQKRFKVVNFIKKTDSWYGEIESINENYDLIDQSSFNVILDKYLKVLLSLNVNHNIQSEIIKTKSFDFTKDLIIPNSLKQEFLELEDESSRMQYIDQFLDSILKNSDKQSNSPLKDNILN
jgi:Lon protease-like protein